RLLSTRGMPVDCLALTRGILSASNLKKNSLHMLLTYSTPGNRNRPLMQLATVVSLLCWFSVGLAQELPQRAPEIDTAYEAQRSKVNDLLTQRSARFGDFNESLQQRTGIFG